MFTATLIATAFLGMFACVGAMTLSDKLKWRSASHALEVLAAIFSAYCIAAGAFLLVGWEDPFSGASSEQIASASTRGRGRGGIVILAIRFWPYVLIGLGAYMFYHALGMLRYWWKMSGRAT